MVVFKILDIILILHLFAISKAICSQNGPKLDREKNNGGIISRASEPCQRAYPTVTSNTCRIRDIVYDEFLYSHVVGCYCLYYNNPVVFKPNINVRYGSCSIDVNGNTYNYPCLCDRTTGNCVDFNYKNSTSWDVIDGIFVSSDATHKWAHCVEAGVQCCSNMDEDDVNTGSDYCPAVWDGWSCAPKSPAGSIYHPACSDYVYVEDTPTCQQYGDKECFASGSWNTTSDYSSCSGNPLRTMKSRYLYHIITLSVSIGICFPALFIFFLYSKLRVTRIVLHRNLILAIIVRNVFAIWKERAILLDAINGALGTGEETTMGVNSEWCRTLTFMDKLSGSAVFSCMLLESIFLHRLIAAAFKGEPKMIYYYITAGAVALVPVAAWTIIEALYDNINCWSVNVNSYSYIIDGPRIATLVVNALLMMDIVRVLCTKLKRVNTAKSGQIRRMTRATILLIPLFGVQFLLTIQKPFGDDCDVEQVYYYIFFTMDGLQGSVVALLYCYLNKEVHVQLLRTYNQVMGRLYSLFGKEFVPGHRPTWAYSDHRHTATSLVPSESVTKPRVSNAHPYDDVLAGESKPRNSIRLGIYGNNPFLNQDPNSTGEHRSISLKGDNSPGLFSDDGPKSPTKRTSVTFSTDVFINIPLSPSKRNSVTFSGNCFPVTPPSPEGRSTTPFLKSSLKHDGLSKRPSYIEGARQRKISSVNEENIYEVIAEDESNKYTPKPREKYRDSDEEAIVFDEGFEGTIPQDFDIQKAEQNVLNVEHTISSETLTPPRLSNGIRKRSTGNASDEETNA